MSAPSPRAPLLAIALAACASDKANDSGVTVPDLLAELRARGPWQAAYVESELSYPDPAGDEVRTLRLAVWYPTEDTDGDDVAYMGAFEAPGVLGGAAPIPGPLPVAVFSHGHRGYAESASFLMTHLARHGWLVVAPDHTGNTTFDDPDRTTEIYLQRPRDISAVIDHLLIDEGVGLYANLASPAVVGLGHSFGGYTNNALAGADYDIEALAAACAAGTGPGAFCSTLTPTLAEAFAEGLDDPRLAGSLTMAPGDFDLFGSAGISAIGAPVLEMTGGLDGSTETDGAPIWEALTQDGQEALRVHIPTAGHQTFSDYSGILETGEDLIEAETGFDIINIYALAWAEHLLGETRYDPVLDGSLEVSSLAELMR